MLSPVSITQLIHDEKAVKFRVNDSYLLSYRVFIKYFSRKRHISIQDFIIGTHFTYGWMPTKLDLYFNKTPCTLKDATKILNRARQSNVISIEELKILRSVINNSLVGTSKLLHFINPHAFPIWDSGVYHYITKERPFTYRVENPHHYLEYKSNCTALSEDSRFPPIHSSINSKLGYSVSSFRAIELIMFMNR